MILLKDELHSSIVKLSSKCTYTQCCGQRKKEMMTGEKINKNKGKGNRDKHEREIGTTIELGLETEQVS